MSGSAGNGKDAELARLRLQVSELKQQISWLENVNDDLMGRIDGLLNRVAFLLRDDRESPSHRKRNLWIVPAAIGALLVSWRRLGTVAKGAVAASTVAAIGAGTAGVLMIQPGAGAPVGAPVPSRPSPSIFATHSPHSRRRAGSPAKHHKASRVHRDNDASQAAQAKTAMPAPSPVPTLPPEPAPSITETVPPGGGPTPTPTFTPSPSPTRTKHPHPHPKKTCLNLILLKLCHG